MPVKTISREYRGHSEEDVNAAGAEDIELMEAAGWRISAQEYEFAVLPTARVELQRTANVGAQTLVTAHAAR